MHFIHPKDRYQLRLDSHLDAWISKDNPVRFLDLLIDQLVRNNPEIFVWKGLQESGRRSYSPATMLKLYLYGYLNQIASSRRLEVETGRNIELIWLLGELRPDFKTIADFRRDNAHQIRLVAIEFRKFLKHQGYMSGKSVSIDGTKIRSVSKQDMLTFEYIADRLNSLESKMDRYIKELGRIDLLEDAQEALTEKAAEEVNKELIDKIAQLQEQVDSLKKKEDMLRQTGLKRMSESDREAPLMKIPSVGKRPGYNLQTAVDEQHKLLAVAEVTTDQCDVNQLVPTVEAMYDQLGVIPQEVTADRGYGVVAQIMEVEQNQQTRCYIPLPSKAQENQDARHGISFEYDAENDQVICSEGQILQALQKGKKEGNQYYDVYAGINCNECKIKKRCTRSAKGRMVKIDFARRAWLEKYKERISTSYATEKIKARKAIAEHPFGILKNMMGKLPLRLRGKIKVQTEIDLYTTAYNLKRMLSIQKIENLILQAENHSWKIA
jgi:transposase